MYFTTLPVSYYNDKNPSKKYTGGYLKYNKRWFVDETQEIIHPD